jgi:hypothetical protein
MKARITIIDLKNLCDKCFSGKEINVEEYAKVKGIIEQCKINFKDDTLLKSYKVPKRTVVVETALIRGVYHPYYPKLKPFEMVVDEELLPVSPANGILGNPINGQGKCPAVQI